MELFQNETRGKLKKLYTQAASVQSKEHPKQLLHVLDKTMQLHNQKAIPSAIMKKDELKERNPPEKNKEKQTACGIPHVGLHIQQLQRSHSGLTSQILQNLQPRTTVLVKLCADIQQRLPGPPELLPGNSLIQLLSGQTLALLHQVKVLPGGYKARQSGECYMRQIIRERLQQPLHLIFATDAFLCN